MKVTLRPGLSVVETAERLGVSPKVVWRLVEQNLLDALVVNEKLWFIPQDSIDRYVAARVDKK